MRDCRVVGVDIKEFLGNHRKEIFIVVLIFLLAFGIRGHLMIYEMPFGYDTYYHARMASYILQDGAIPANDDFAYWQFGENGNPPPPVAFFFWNISTAFYKIFTLGAPYDKDTWIFFVKLLPALFGALIAAAMYFLGREIYNRKAGYVMAFIAAIVPAFVYRTMAGFFEEDSLGFLWLVIGLILMAKALKNFEFNRNTVIYSVIASISFAIMAISWGMGVIVPVLIVAYFIFAFPNIYAKRTKQELTNFLKTMGALVFSYLAILMIIFPIIGWDFWGWLNTVTGFIYAFIPGGEIVLLSGLAIVLALYAYLYITKDKQFKGENTTVKAVALIAMLFVLVSIGVVFMTKDNMRGTGVIELTVGEESKGITFFGEKYGALIIFPILALILIPLRIYRDKKDHLSIILFMWIAVTLIMAWYKLKFTFSFGLPVAVAAGVVATELFYFLKEREKAESKVVFIVLGIMLLTGLGAASIFVPNNIPSIETQAGWKYASAWLKDNTPEDATLFNWWNYGHWLAFLSERAVFIDNRNLDMESPRDFGLFTINTDLEPSIEILQRHNPDYIIYNNGIFQSEASLAIYAYNSISDPRIAQYSGIVYACNRDTSGGEMRYLCGANNFSEAQMNSINIFWTETVTQVQGSNMPIYIYREPDNSYIYMLNVATNFSTATKMWFHEPETEKYVEEVYSRFGIKIFKVIK